MTRRFFYDCEFMEEPGYLELISIGVVDESGEREFYACSLEADRNRANSWVRENVIPKLPDKDSMSGYIPVWMWRDEIRRRLLAFLTPTEDDPVELWGYYADYDHVLLCWIFGRMVDLPPGMPMLTLDLQQEILRIKSSIKSKLIDKAIPSPKNEHDALADAKWNREVWLALRNLQGEQ